MQYIQQLLGQPPLELYMTPVFFCSNIFFTDCLVNIFPFRGNLKFSSCISFEHSSFPVYIVTYLNRSLLQCQIQSIALTEMSLNPKYWHYFLGLQYQ
jgi:hypothetical protein